MITLRYRTLMAFAAGLTVALIGVFAFQSWRADAAPGDSDTTFVPITACRLIDTRPAPNRVGSVGTFTADDTNTIQARGPNGNCTISTDAVGLSLNVTAVDASQATFLTVWPGGTKPTASSLNPTPGEPPAPNAVTTQLSTSGAFNVFNRFGTVDVIIDVNGYYTKTSLTDLATRLATTESKVAVLEERTPLVFSVERMEKLITPVPEEVVGTEGFTPMLAPVDGNYVVNSTTSVFEPTADDGVNCSITKGTTLTHKLQTWESAGLAGDFGQLAGTAQFFVRAGQPIDANLVCVHYGSTGSSTLRDLMITIIFIPS